MAYSSEEHEAYVMSRMNPCSECGKKQMLYLHYPCYANESGCMIECGSCGNITESYVLGEYGEGMTLALEEWNSKGYKR